jgi:hypothetical protein
VEADGFGVSDWLKSIGGVLFFVAGVLTWWELEYGQGLSTAFNGFDYRYTGIVPYVIFVGIAILTIIIKTESLALPRFLVNPVLTLAVAVVATALVVYRFFADGYDNEALEDQGNTVSRGIGLYLALAGALIVLAGCVLAYRDYRTAELEDEIDEPADDTPNTIERPPRRSSPPLP